MLPDMSRATERYLALIESRRQKTSDRGYKCLCCRDGGLILSETIRRYSLLEGMLGEYDSVFLGDAGVLCQNPRCGGNFTEVQCQGETGSTYTKTTKRFAENALITSISPETCEWVHNQEVARWQKIHERTLKSAEPPDLRAAVAEIEQWQAASEDDHEF